MRPRDPNARRFPDADAPGIVRHGRGHPHLVQAHGADADAQLVRDGLALYNVGRTGHDYWRPVKLFVRDSTGLIRGGLLGDIWGDWLEVKILWLEKRLRGAGLGRRLMETAEAEARAAGCRYARLDATASRRLTSTRSSATKSSAGSRTHRWATNKSSSGSVCNTTPLNVAEPSGLHRAGYLRLLHRIKTSPQNRSTARLPHPTQPLRTRPAKTAAPRTGTLAAAPGPPAGPRPLLRRSARHPGCRRTLSGAGTAHAYTRTAGSVLLAPARGRRRSDAVHLSSRVQPPASTSSFQLPSPWSPSSHLHHLP